MIITGLFFLALISLALGSVVGAVKMVLVRHVIQSFVIVIVVFVLAAAFEVTLLLMLRSQVPSYKKFWNAQSQPTSNQLVYVALGDSAAQGIGASSPNSSYVKLLAANMESQTGRQVHIINLSSSGAKLHDLIGSQIPKLHGLRPNIVTVDIGANDIAAGTSQHTMLQEYSQAINALSPYPVVFANLPDFMWGTQQRNTVVLNKTIRTLCEQHGLQLADLHYMTHQKMWNLNEFAADAFHPSNTGHHTWAAAFIPGTDHLLQAITGN